MKKLLTFLLLSVTLAGCNYSDTSYDTTEPLNPVDEQDQTLGTETLEETQEPQTELDDSTTAEELLPATFPETKESAYEYLMLVAPSDNPYKTDEPSGVVLIGMITGEGGFWHTEFWGMEEWEQKESEAIQNFYIKSESSQPNSSEITETWYGPFRGKLGMLVEEAKNDPRLVVELE